MGQVGGRKEDSPLVQVQGGVFEQRIAKYSRMGGFHAWGPMEMIWLDMEASELSQPPGYS